MFTRAEYLVAEPEGARRDLAAQGITEEEAAALTPRVRTVTDGQEDLPRRAGPDHRRAHGRHAQYVITGGGTRLIAFGDALHSPIQVDHPEWSCLYDHAPARFAEHRRRLVAELEEPDTIGFGIHFADAVFGQVRRDGTTPAWRPLDT